MSRTTNCPNKFSACNNVDELRRGNEYGDFLCEKEDCEWWDVDDETCCIRTIAGCLRNM